MSEEIKVKPTPIQRNAFDVAMELTQIYIQRIGIDSAEDIEERFMKYYSIACVCSNTNPSRLLDFVPDDLKKAYNQR